MDQMMAGKWAAWKVLWRVGPWAGYLVASWVEQKVAKKVDA